MLLDFVIYPIIGGGALTLGIIKSTLQSKTNRKYDKPFDVISK